MISLADKSSAVASLSYRLSERFRKLHNIMVFVKESGAEVTESTRTLLMYNAEKAFAALQLCNVYEQSLR
jgi:hypothetical protein